MYAVLLSAVLVFMAELGDKSQLIAMTFATRYRARTVILGAGIASAAMNLLSAVVGNAIGDALPERAVRVGSGILFIIFGLLTLLSLRGDDEAKAPQRGGKAIVVVAVTFALAELGDKTMLATLTLSTQYHWALIWIGSTLGMLTSIVLAVFAGRALLRVLPIRVLHVVSAMLFAGVGVWLLVS